MSRGGDARADWAARRAAAAVERRLRHDPDDSRALYPGAAAAPEALDRAVATGRGSRKWFDNDHDLDPIRGDPRFAAIMARCRPEDDPGPPAALPEGAPPAPGAA